MIIDEVDQIDGNNNTNVHDIVEEIINKCNIPIQLGGGIRNLETIEMWLSKGLERVILGTVAVENPSLVKLAASKYPGKIIQ